MKRNLRYSLLGAFLLGLLIVTTGRLAHADSVITNCSSDAQLTTALATGGNITFNCGSATLTFSGQKTIQVNTTIDGGGKITFNGANTTRLFWISSGKALTLENLVLTNGYSGSSYGGCIYVDGGTLIVSNTTIQYCSTNGYAGGAIVSPLGNVTLDHAIMKNNSASSGGALSATGVVNIYSSQFLANTATTNVGGALSLAANVAIYHSTFTGNKATGLNSEGGAIYANGNVGIHQGTFGANQGDKGGAIYVGSGSNLTLDARSTLGGNEAGLNGGGIFNDSGTLTLTDTTLSGNHSAYSGGGIFSDHGTITLTNATLSSNYASFAAGGGIGNLYGTVTLTNVTLSANSAFSGGGGIASGNGTVTLKNTLLAKGTSGTNCDGFTGGIFSLSDDNSCGFGAGHDNVALLLGPLSYHGSSVQTNLPKTGSPAIDGGTSIDAPTTDERGYARPYGIAVDIGAVEACTIKPDKPVLSAPSNNTKSKSVNVALNWDDTNCADKYKVTIQDATTGRKVDSKKNLQTSDYTTIALVKSKSYLWYVQACNTVGCTRSDTWKFKLK